MTEKYANSPTECPFKLANLSPASRLYLIHDNHGWKIFYDGKEYDNVWNLALNRCWQYLRLDNFGSRMLYNNELNPKFIRDNYKPEDLYLSNIYKIAFNESKNELEIITKPYHKQVVKLKHQHISPKQVKERKDICYAANKNYDMFKADYFKANYPNWIKLITKVSGDNKPVLLLYELWDLCAICKSINIKHKLTENGIELEPGNPFPNGLAGKINEAIKHCTSQNVQMMPWAKTIKQAAKEEDNLALVLLAEKDQPGYLTNDELRLVKRLYDDLRILDMNTSLLSKRPIRKTPFSDVKDGYKHCNESKLSEPWWP